MRPRTALIAVLAVALAAPVPASAATKKKKKPAPLPKTCNLFTDPSGDGKWSFHKSDALDVLGGDIATGPKEMVAVIRLTSANFASDPVHRVGYQWALQTTAAGSKYAFAARNDAWGNVIPEVSVSDKGVKNFEFKIDGNMLIWRVKRSELPTLARPNLVFTDFVGGSKAFSNTADSGDFSKKKYIDRQPSCVVAK